MAQKGFRVLPQKTRITITLKSNDESMNIIYEPMTVIFIWIDEYYLTDYI